MAKVGVIGDGGWGTALALLLHNKGVSTILWSISAEYAEALKQKRENTKFLKGIPLPESLEITSDDSLIKSTEYVFFAVPCAYLRSIAKRFKGSNFTYIVSATKGIEVGSLKRPSEILCEYFDRDSISVLSGPTISTEVARGIPTTAVTASYKRGEAKIIQDLLTTERFRIYTSDDVIGVELGGALKNIIAIAAGISDGLGFGANSKAAILTRGLVEITRLGVKMGATSATFKGLSALGDLATTCISSDSRNRWFGQEVAKGRKINDILAETPKVVEGVSTCKSVYELARKYSVEMPITQKIYEIIYEGKSPQAAVKELMMREAKEEECE